MVAMVDKNFLIYGSSPSRGTFFYFLKNSIKFWANRVFPGQIENNNYKGSNIRI